MANKDAEVKRSYTSAVRRERARATQVVVVESARSLFVEHGYVATSMDAIATAAGVSRATVFNSVGGKPALLRRAYEVAVRGDYDPAPLGRRASARRTLAQPDPHRLLEEYAAVCAGFGPRLGPIYEVVRAAARADPDARQLWETITQERRTGAGRIIRAIAKRGPLRGDLDRRMATDVLWVLNDPGLFRSLVELRGWTSRRFETWLARAMRTELLPPT
jgi:AcrR family transcriptional regulator